MHIANPIYDAVFKFMMEDEKLLSIFDQESITKNHHILNVNEEDFPRNISLLSNN
jgi:hypothetical protein